jgi:hypothetical protein
MSGSGEEGEKEEGNWRRKKETFVVTVKKK